MTRLGTFSAKQEEAEGYEKAPSDGWRGCALVATEYGYSACVPEPAIMRALRERQPAMMRTTSMRAR